MIAHSLAVIQSYLRHLPTMFAIQKDIFVAGIAQLVRARDCGS